MQTSVTRSRIQRVTMMAGLLLIVAGVDTGSAAVNAWTDPVSGSWGTAGNWSAGLPQSNQDASLAVAGAYTVTVDDITADNALGLVVTNITVGAASGPPALTVDFTNTTRTVTVGAANDGKIGVGISAGSLGRLSVANGQITAARLHLGSGLGGAGSVHLSGGSVALRSMSATAGTEWLRLGSDAGSTGTLVMTGGQISGPSDYGGTYGHIGGGGSGLIIISNGLFRTGGYGLYFGASSGHGELKLYGGTLYSGNDNSTKNVTIEVGSGVNSEGFILIDGGTLIVTNNADLSLGVRGGSHGVLTISNGVFNIAGGDLGLGMRANSLGELNVVGGTNLCDTPLIGSGAVNVGGGTGIVNVFANGYLASLGGYAQLGQGPGSRGTLNVSGNGRCEIGGYGMLMGDGDGAWSEINVAGGEFRMTAGAVYLRSGTINVSGGSFQTGTLLLGTTGGIGSAKTGTVSIAGGTVTLGTTTLGMAGRPGFLRVAGSAPSAVTVNALTAITADSTLQFTLDAAGVTPITVNNTLTVNADTKLEVDCGAYDTRNGLAVPLIAYNTRSGTFDASNIAIINTGSATASVDPGDGSADAVTLRITLPPGGTVLLIR